MGSYKGAHLTGVGSPPLRLQGVHGAAVGALGLAARLDRQVHARVRVPQGHARHRAGQRQVRAGDLVDVDLKGLPEQQSITFDRVLMIRGDGGVKIGTPTVAGAKVVATVVGDVKGRKLIIRKYRRRKNYRRKQGHRQHYTRVKIESIEA